MLLQYLKIFHDIEILGSHGSEYLDYIFLGYSAV
jgi:hypothetical protein